ncbi:MAG: hypothetical protein KDB86_10555 [Actinobacteria bacterium]|nr:hypothetical protein [Actinomycetota bacterium]MCB9388225.1 hypothetical protein [Acidimicrobiia bacterium]
MIDFDDAFSISGFFVDSVLFFFEEIEWYGFLVVEGEQFLSLVCKGAESGLLTFDVGLDGLVAFDQSLTEESDDFVSGGFG